MIGEEVQVSKGVKRFTLLFVVCAVLGVFSNKLIQQAVQVSWAPLDQQMSSQGVRAAQPRIVFSRYGFPSFGAWVDTLSWQKPEKCRSLRVIAKDIFVPIPFFELFFSRPRAGAIAVDHLIVEHQPVAGCKKEDLPEVGPLALSPSESQAEAAPFFTDPAMKSWGSKIEKVIFDLRRLRSQMPFSKLSLHHIEIKNYMIGGKTLSAEGEGYMSTGEVAQVSFYFPSVSLKKEKYSIKTKLSVELLVQENVLKSHLDWSYDEGHLLWSTSVDEKDQLTSKIQLNNAPVSVVNRWLNTPWSFQFLWANCELQLRGSVGKIDKESWDVSACSITGPKGMVKVSDGKLRSLQLPQKLKFDVSFENFEVDGAVKGVRELPMAGVFNKFGIVNGKMLLRDRDVSAKLQVQSSEILFSKNNKRKLQELESFDLDIHYSDKKWDISLPHIKPKEGVYEGVISAQFNKTQQVWSGVVDVDKIALNSEVQQLMWGGEVSPLSLKGDVSIKNKEGMQKLTLAGRFADAQVRGIHLEKGEFVVDHTPEEGIRMSMTLGKAEIYKGKSSDWIFASLLGRAQGIDKLEIVRVFGELSLAPGHFVVRKSYGSTLNGKVNLSGVYTPLLQSGTLAWELPQEQYEWEWQRDQGVVELIPLHPFMAEWVAANGDFIKEFKGVKIVSQKTLKPPGEG